MRDSTRFADIPLDGCDVLMGYVFDARVSGTDKGWSDDEWAQARATGKKLVRLCIFNDRFDANVIDCEPGNADAVGIVPWERGKWLRGDVPTVYCFTDEGPVGYRISDVRAACDAAGVKRPLILIADYDGIAVIPDDPEIVGKQYANDALTGGHYDASVVRDHWPGVNSDVTPEQVKALIAEYAQRLETEELLPMKQRLDALDTHVHAAGTSVGPPKQP